MKHLTRLTWATIFDLVQHHNVGDFSHKSSISLVTKTVVSTLGHIGCRRPVGSISLVGIIHNQTAGRRGNTTAGFTTGKKLGTQIQLFNQPHLRGQLLQPVFESVRLIKSKAISSATVSNPFSWPVDFYNSIHGIINGPIVRHSLAKHVPIALKVIQQTQF